ncbi:MAG: hypothetical protein COA90_06775 [Gammaproteobacteria bacterium]|nr:MAG: hypothetical protein COA90_06775 [Gammaproteobacteria bacterium]
MEIETIRLYSEVAGYAAGVLSVLFLAVQMRGQRKLEEYKTLQALEEKYTTLLWRADEQSEINQVWNPISEVLKQKLDSIPQDSPEGVWPIWNLMSDDEKNCYRFTRSGFEILEQAYIANRQGWVSDKEIQLKWKHWMLSWKNSNTYSPYVLAEMPHWFTPSFIKYYNALK